MEERIPVSQYGVKLIVGLFFTAVGLLLTLDNLRMLPAERYLRYWPVVLIVIGVVKLPRIFGAILAAAGALMLAYNLHWIRFTVFDLWPVLLIGFGVATVMRALGYGHRVVENDSSRDIWVVFGSRNVTNTSRDFSGANIFAFMGGCQLDLTDANIARSPAVIDATAIWGGIEIFVPERWEVVGEVVPFMGGFEIKAAPVGKPERQLIVRGAAVMGGIEVKRRKS